MKIRERIWLILFTFLQLITPFLCDTYKESLSYEKLLFAIPVGMAFLYICLLGVDRPFETDVTELFIFQVYLVLIGVVIFLFLLFDIPKEQFGKRGTMFILLGLGSLATVLIQDILFAIIFILIAKLLGLESIFAKQRRENEAFYRKSSEPCDGYKNVYEKMYWEELERRQREEFKRKWNFHGGLGADYEQWHRRRDTDNNKSEYKEPVKPRRFLFENTVHFQSIESLEEVRPRYIKLMKRYHPDMPGGSKEICQEIQSEYDKICEENGL